MRFEQYKKRINEIKKLMMKYDGDITSLINAIQNYKETVIDDFNKKLNKITDSKIYQGTGKIGEEEIEEFIKEIDSLETTFSGPVNDNYYLVANRYIRDNFANSFYELVYRSNISGNKEREIEELKEDLHQVIQKREEKSRIKNLVKDIKDENIPLDFENAFATDIESNNIQCETASDGLVYSINNLGRVDIEYISKITGLSLVQVIKDLDGTIYQNPLTWNEVFYKGWETKEQYLVGNLNIKYKDAVEANKKYCGLFQKNVELIDEVSKNFPQVKIDDIYFTLGSPWIPVDIVSDFIKSLLLIDDIEVVHNTFSDTWKVKSHSNKAAYSTENNFTYGTSKMTAIALIRHILNQTEISANDNINKVVDGETKKVRTKNQEETMLLLEKEKLIKEEFKKFIYNNFERKNTIANIYNNLYCKNFVRHYDGSFLKLEDSNPNIQLYPYQKNAIARIIFSGNCLLAHDVGSGKTYEMIAAGHELIRMKLSKKNLFVVPNNVLSQWKEMYLNLYPNANILVISPNDFTKNKRKKVLQDIIDNTYEGIIISYSSFDLIEVSPESKRKNYLKRVKEINENIKKESENSPISELKLMFLISQKEIDKNLKEIGENVDGEIYFDDLDINYLFIDEAHNYKNIPLDCNMVFEGISVAGSKKCEEMLSKVRLIHEKNNDKGVIMATATPITNSLSDAYTFQKYLQETTLKFLNINTFKSWLQNYAEKESEFEVSVDTSSFKLRNRFSKFHNLPELSALLSNVADFYHIDNQEDLPRFNGYDDVILKPSPELKNIIKDISKRADNIKNRKPQIFIRNNNQVKDNMLLLTIDGRRAALDTRLYDDKLPYSKESKVYCCAKNVASIYFEKMEEKLTQVIFCDISTPKQSFNIYDELKRLLVSDFNVNPKDIDYIHNYEDDEERLELFKKVNNGEIRILIGSTFKLGIGVNIQKRLYAIHHIDVPWRPSDMIQREGRIIRPGNSNPEVHIYRYVSEGSFDAYSWQILESKQKFIAAILTNNVFNRDGDDISDTILKYAEIKALAIGNPLVKERTEKYNQLIKLISLERKEKEDKESLKARLVTIKNRLDYLDKEIAVEEKDLDYILSLDTSDEEKEARLDLTKQIFIGLTEAFKERVEKEVGEYFGFKIIAPSFQDSLGNKNLYIQREGKYMLKILDSEKSVNFVLINFFKNFNKRVAKLKDEYDTKHVYYLKGIKEANQVQSYSEEINLLKCELDSIDKKLGIDK